MGRLKMHDAKMTHIVDAEYRSLEYDELESNGPFVIFQTHEILLMCHFPVRRFPVPEIQLHRASSVILQFVRIQSLSFPCASFSAAPISAFNYQ